MGQVMTEKEQTAISELEITAYADKVAAEIAEENLFPAAITLATMAYSKVTFRLLREIIQSTPRQNNPDPKGAFTEAYAIVNKNVKIEADAYLNGLSDDECNKLKSSKDYVEEMNERIYNCHQLSKLYRFFCINIYKWPPQDYLDIEKKCLDFIQCLLHPAMLFELAELRNSDFDMMNNEEKLDVELCAVRLRSYFGGNRDIQPRKIVWQDAIEYAQVTESTQKKTVATLLAQLGYVPAIWIRLPYELQIHRLWQLETSDKRSDGFIDNLIPIIKKIRNKDLKKDGRYTTEVYNEKDFEDYNTNLQPLANAARERVAKALGYYPDLQHSLWAEVLLRHYMVKDDFHPDKPMQPFDWQAAQLIRYREHLLNSGIEAADESMYFIPDPDFIEKMFRK